MFYGNIRFLYEKKYMVSWKADGTRLLKLNQINFTHNNFNIIHKLDI